MPRGKSERDTTLLSMALVGYEAEKQRIETKIEELRALLNGHSSPVPARKSAPVSASVSEGETPKRRTLSAAARKRIAAAQRKRWAEHRKNLAATK